MSCNDQTSNLGADFVKTSTFDIGVIDTLTLNASTVLFDSLKTSSPDKFLLGRHIDEKLGIVTATPVFQLTPKSVSQLDKNYTTYQGLTLTIKTSGYYYYDTTVMHKVSVHKVTDEIKLYNGGKYNVSHFTVDPTPIGSLSFASRPLHTSDTIEVALSDDWGKEIFGLLQTGDEQVLQSDQFLKYLRGLAIVPDNTENTGILGINTAVELRLYYYDKTVLPSKKKYVSFGGSSGIYFNSIIADRSSTLLKDLTTLKKPISTEKTGNASFMQSGTGLGIRIEVPYLRNLLVIDGSFSASSAVLEMVPVSGYKTKTATIPTSLVGYFVDSENTILTSTTYTAPLVDDTENLERSIRYSVDIASFVNSQLLTDANNENALLFVINDSNFKNTLGRLAIGDTKSQYTMKLNLYYVTLPK